MFAKFLKLIRITVTDYAENAVYALIKCSFFISYFTWNCVFLRNIEKALCCENYILFLG